LTEFEIFNSKIVNRFALGVAGKNLFELFQRKKFGTKNPTRQLAGNAQQTIYII